MKPEQKATKKDLSKAGSDRFAMYAAVVVLLFFCAVAFFIYVGRNAKNDANISYLELKKSYVNDQGLVGRLMVSIQVNQGDESWLDDNKAILNEQFQKELTVIDLETLRTKEGILELQDELRRKFNQVLKTDKIEAVMVTEVLLQDQRIE
ncbi:flagellar basal body-associated FliL family protein [Undibacterium flavidum]|uniref:Flagellar protein FliL n=1 Tax=Undibacterium flavidum TaxID=2762297 RepID=A0ABR6YEM9_9BURK|nr:flagellar basal body-associated FliL family protein [Undibacterium flavidum]MBC3875025.1 flagellar basal body-associated FliL family protein [Undibacterium flavidum]